MLAWGRYYPQSCFRVSACFLWFADKKLVLERYYPQSRFRSNAWLFFFADKELV
jgi:hypothetical protein